MTEGLIAHKYEVGDDRRSMEQQFSGTDDDTQIGPRNSMEMDVHVYTKGSKS